MQSLEKIYNESKKPCMLLVDKRLSFDTSFKSKRIRRIPYIPFLYSNSIFDIFDNRLDYVSYSMYHRINI